jgi:hypothetical protein
LKKPTGSVWFYKHETEKTEPNPNQKNRAKPEKNWPKPSQTEKTKSNRFEPVFVQKKEPKPVNLKIELVSIFLKKNSI